MEPNESTPAVQNAPRHAAKQIEIPPDPELGNWNPLSVLLLVVGLVGFVALTVLVFMANKGPLGFDETVLNYMIDHVRSEKVTQIVMYVTDLAMPAALLLVALCLTVFAPSPAPVLALVLCALPGWLLNTLIKSLIARPRPPEELRLAVETSASFPSSHAVIVMVFYGFILWLVWHYQRNNPWRIFVAVFMALFIAAVGLTRIYLGVHWTSDVLAGFCFGLVWLVLYTRLVAPRILAQTPTRNQDEQASF
jgi:undecaprenyl-diphosphatase